MKNTIIVLLTLMASSFSHALGYTVSYDEIKDQLFGTIRKITICGSYSYDNAIGEVRLIESYTYGGGMIFIDTIKMGKSGLEVLHGITIAETNNDHMELNIENLNCSDLGNNQIEVQGMVNGTGHEDNVNYQFTIKYNAHSGAYKYSESFNMSVHSTPSATSD